MTSETNNNVSEMSRVQLLGAKYETSSYTDRIAMVRGDDMIGMGR